MFTELKIPFLQDRHSSLKRGVPSVTHTEDQNNNLPSRSQLFEGWIALSTGYSIGFASVHPVDSVVYLLNNRGQKVTVWLNG